MKKTFDVGCRSIKVNWSVFEGLTRYVLAVDDDGLSDTVCFSVVFPWSTSSATTITTGKGKGRPDFGLRTACHR